MFQLKLYHISFAFGNKHIDITTFFRYNLITLTGGGIHLRIDQKRDFLISCAYWLVIAATVYVSCKYILPISVPFILGILIASLVVNITKKIRCTHKLVRLAVAIAIYGIIGLLITLLINVSISAVSALIQWLSKLYQSKVLPLATVLYQWGDETIQGLDPALVSTIEQLLANALSATKDLLSYLSGLAVNLVSALVTGVPSLILSLLAMIFSTVFLVADYDRIYGFCSENIPLGIKKVLKEIRYYLKNTLFVVIRSYGLIMLITFTELSVLFSVFGIRQPILKAALIAVLDIMPILGTGGIMIPWAVISFVLGDPSHGIRLLVIYAIVTVIRNYVEPRIVGTQLGLHPIITLVSMFIGLRLFGFLGLFGLPVVISFLWKQKVKYSNTKNADSTENPLPTDGT